MDITRRCFACGAFSALSWAALAEELPKTKPELRFGVVSDVHLRSHKMPEVYGTDRWWRKALAWFRERNVDAVLATGDLTDQGLVEEMETFAKARYDVFGDTSVEKIFLCGNHDYEGWWYWGHTKEELEELSKHALVPKKSSDFSRLAKEWERIFHEPWTPIFAKQVKGYSFVCSHWDQQGGLADFLEKLVPPMDRPFFYAQHEQIQDTCYGPIGGRHDRMRARTALDLWRNAVAFSGHTHQSPVDGHFIWQETFTAIGVGSLGYLGMPPGRENSDQGLHHNRHMPALGENWRVCKRGWPPENTIMDTLQGQLVSVWKDCIVVEPYDFFNDCPSRPPAIIPLPFRPGSGNKFSFEQQAKKWAAPTFTKDATITVRQCKGKWRGREEEEQIAVQFPPALARSAFNRPFDYEVQLIAHEPGFQRIVSTKRILSAKYCYAHEIAAKWDGPEECRFGLSEIPAGTPVRITVTPLNCFGKRGIPLERPAQPLVKNVWPRFTDPKNPPDGR